MSAGEDQTQAFTGWTKAARHKVKSSKKSKKLKMKIAKVKDNKSRERARVNIGSAVSKWRAMKVGYGLRSDQEMALCLLDRMKTQSPESFSAAGSDLKRTFSRSEVQTLIEQEVHRAVKDNETQLQGLVETIQQMNHEENFENSIQKLQARIDLVSRRTEEALSYLKKTEKKSPLPEDSVDIGRGDLKNEKMKTTLQNKERTECEAKSGAIMRLVESTQNALKKIYKENESLTAAITHLSHDEPPPVLTPHDSPDRTEPNVDVKNEPGSDQEQEPTPSSRHEHEEKDKEEGWVVYPPLPATTFPSVLSIEAASYSIPQRLEVNLALIKNPTRLSVLWNVVEEDPSAPPMESYTIFLTMEKTKGSGVFPDWHTYDKVEAMALPMCALIKKYKRGHKVCAAVLGKDIFGRYGPYSKVVTATIPD